MSKAYFLAEANHPPHLTDGRKWHVMRVGMGHVGRHSGGSPVNTTLHVPVYTLVATDREAAKEAICEKIDQLFDCVEEDGDASV